MKKNIILIISLSIISLSIVSANDCDILKPTLDQFYSASKDENLEEYMNIIDMDYIETMVENYDEYVKSAWEVYDVSDYEIKAYNCKIENDDAIFYFNLKSTLVGEETTEVQRNYIGVFHKLDTWKIRYVMDEEIFDKYQDAKNGNLFIGATEEILDKAISEAEAFVEAAEQETGTQLGTLGTDNNIEMENYDNIKQTEGDNSLNQVRERVGSDKGDENDRCRLPYIILLSIILFILYKFIKLEDYKKLKDLDNKGKAKFIGGKSWEYLKEYGRIVWDFTKKASIIIGKFLKTVYIKLKPIVIKLSRKALELIKNISKKKESKEEKNTTPKE